MPRNARTPDPAQSALEAVRREQILEAAARVFAEAGFHSARMQDVAARAGLSNGTLYNYFTSKEDLLLALLDRLNESEERPNQLKSLEGESPRSTLKRLMHHRFEEVASQKELLRALLPEILSNRKLAQRYHRRVLAPTLRLGEEALRELGATEPGSLARAMAASLFGLLVMDLIGDARSREEARSVVDLLAETFGRELTGSRKARRR